MAAQQEAELGEIEGDQPFAAPLRETLLGGTDDGVLGMCCADLPKPRPPIFPTRASILPVQGRHKPGRCSGMSVRRRFVGAHVLRPRMLEHVDFP